MAAAMVLASPLLAMAQTAGSSGGGDGLRAGLIGLGAGIGIGIAALGCGMGQGKLAASAMESIGRNPNSTNQLFVPMIIGLAFVESLTLCPAWRRASSRPRSQGPAPLPWGGHGRISALTTTAP